MRRLVLRISVSADDFIAGPNGEVDWMAKTRSPAGAAWVAERISQAGAHLFGRKSFSEIAPFWSRRERSTSIGSRFTRSYWGADLIYFPI
jgi:dihydrofolate reductase